MKQDFVVLTINDCRFTYTLTPLYSDNIHVRALDSKPQKPVAHSLYSARGIHAPPPFFPSTFSPSSVRSKPPSLVPSRNTHALSCSWAVRSPLSSRSLAPKRRVVAAAVGGAFSDPGFDVAEALGEVTIFTASGEPVKFDGLWDQNEGIAVVALLRHFGCFCCWELASALKEEKARFDSAGVRLVAIGVGTPDKARILADRLPFPKDCLYADPDRKAYDALGLYYGLGRTFFNPASTKVFSRIEAVQKAMKNYTIEATPDDRSSVLQQGGMFVFKGKQLLYARKDEGTGDHAPLDDIFNVCCNVQPS